MTLAKSKAGELELMDLQAKYTYDRDLMNSLYMFMKDVGLLPNPNITKAGIQERVREFHKALCLNNSAFPDTEPYDSIYPKFISFVLKADLSIQNVSQLVQLFTDWYEPPEAPEEPDKPETGPRADPGEAQGRPLPAPRPDVPVDPEEATGGVDNWSDRVLKQQYETILNLYNEEKIIENLENRSCYSTRVIREMKRRGFDVRF